MIAPNFRNPTRPSLPAMEQIAIAATFLDTLSFLLRVATIAARQNKSTGRDFVTRQLKHSLLRAALVMLAMPVVAQRTATADPGPAQRSRPTPGN
jgi:hypothetical protein